MGTLTDVQIRNWIKAGLPVAKSDGNGLTFTLSKNGAVVFALRYSIASKRKELTLGRYPDLTLADARALAGKKRADVQQGVDVAREKRNALSATASAWSFRRLSEDYLTRSEKHLAASTLIGRQQQLRDYVWRRIGHLADRDVTPADIVDVVERAARKSAHVAKLVLIAIREVFGHGIGRQVVEANPCVHITAKAIIDKAPPRRARINLGDDEIRAMLTALPTLGRSNELLIKILLATGTRIGELILAEWLEIDFEQQLWTIPPEHIKFGMRTGRTFVIPLTQQVCGWFMELKALAYESIYVLPIRTRFHGREGDAHMTATTVNAALKVLHKSLGDKCRRFTPHDLRSTARSHLSELGVEILIAERCLNHSLGGLVAVYDQHDFIKERRAALSLWSDKIRALEKGETLTRLRLVAAD
jgi:integrase